MKLQTLWSVSFFPYTSSVLGRVQPNLYDKCELASYTLSVYLQGYIYICL